MEIMLLDNIHKLGRIGDRVKVKAGFARNYLLPQGKAVVVNKDNLEALEARRAELEARAAQLLAESKQCAQAVEALGKITIAARVSSEDKLYGSVSVMDIAQAITEAGVEVEKKAICMPDGPIRHLGEYTIDLQFDGDVVAPIVVEVVSESD